MHRPGSRSTSMKTKLAPALESLAIACLSLPHRALAQQPPAEAIDSNELDYPVVNTPTRLRQSLSDVPASTTVITADTIRRHGITRIEEALRLVPGMAVSRASGNDYRINYHGTDATNPRRLNVLIDSESTYRPGFSRVDCPLLPVALEDVDRIEVTRGPNSAAYTPNSRMVVINILTKHPKDVDQGMVDTRTQLEVQDTHVVSEALRLVGGMGLCYQATDSDTYFGGKVGNTVRWPFGHVEYRPTSTATLNVGGYGESNSLGRSTFSPRLAVNYHFSEPLRPHRSKRITHLPAGRPARLVQAGDELPAHARRQHVSLQRWGLPIQLQRSTQSALHGPCGVLSRTGHHNAQADT